MAFDILGREVLAGDWVVINPPGRRDRVLICQVKNAGPVAITVDVMDRGEKTKTVRKSFLKLVPVAHDALMNAGDYEFVSDAYEAAKTLPE